MVVYYFRLRRSGDYGIGRILCYEACNKKDDTENDVKKMVGHVGGDETEQHAAVRHQDESEYREKQIYDAENLEPEARFHRSHESHCKQDETEREMHEVMQMIRFEYRPDTYERISHPTQDSDENEYNTKY